MIDFSVLKRLVREACERLDHRFLLQRDSQLLAIDEQADAWVVRFGEREYRFPAEDVAVLPIENSTAELLAQWLCETVAAALAAEGTDNLTCIAVEVEEMPGQSGSYEREIAAG